MEQPIIGIALIMNIYFNDLTLDAIHNANEGRPIFHNFIEHILKQVLVKTKLKHIYCNDLNKIKNKCVMINNKDTLTTTFFTFFRAPYVESDFSNTTDENRYCSSNFYITKDSCEIECPDLGCAIMKNSITLGLPSEPYWEKESYVVCERNGTHEQNHSVLCLTKSEHLFLQVFTDWIEKNFYSEPEITNLSPEEKTIKLRDDHGKNRLMDFSLKILRSPYVIGIVNSLPFRKHQKVFINMNQNFENGQIEICLHWTPQKLGMVLQTTAKNKYQAIKVAKCLVAVFDQKS